MTERAQRAMDMSMLSASTAKRAGQYRPAIEAGGLMRMAVTFARAGFDRACHHRSADHIRRRPDFTHHRPLPASYRAKVARVEGGC